MKIFSLCILIFLFFFSWGYGVERLEEGHVHEAFMNKEAPVSLLTAIRQPPPSPLKEVLPPSNISEEVWIAGYWEWLPERGEFVWCSGCYRRPPPGRQWVDGFWQETQQGWVRVPGFWSASAISRSSFIHEPPPDPYDENPRNQPGKDYFWMSGYWKYERSKYVWYGGKWEPLDANWVYVPPKYMWHPSGYIFVPAFWDWPLEERGTAYACLAIPMQERQIRYLPDMILEPHIILDGCLFYYPDYSYFFFYHCHVHPDWWWGCAWCPPWWGWEGWWWLPWWDHWGLWWWWCHPGFPAPWWFQDAWGNLIFAPPGGLIHAMKNVHPPVIIGPKGAIPPSLLLHEEEGVPIFPEDPLRLQEQAGKNVQPGKPIKPSGPQVSLDVLREKAPQLPQTTPLPPENVKPGSQPRLPKVPPTVKTPKKPLEPRPYQPQTYFTPDRTPDYTPPTYQPDRGRVPQRPPSPPQDYPPVKPEGRRPSYPPLKPDTQPSYPPAKPQRPSYPPLKQPDSRQPLIPQVKPPSSQTPGQYTPQSPGITQPLPQTGRQPQSGAPSIQTFPQPQKPIQGIRKGT